MEQTHVLHPKTNDINVTPLQRGFPRILALSKADKSPRSGSRLCLRGGTTTIDRCCEFGALWAKVAAYLLHGLGLLAMRIPLSKSQIWSAFAVILLSLGLILNSSRLHDRQASSDGSFGVSANHNFRAHFLHLALAALFLSFWTPKMEYFLIFSIFCSARDKSVATAEPVRSLLI